MRLAFHTCVLVLGILSMGFQLLASRLLNPHFGSSLIVWAWLISTFLAAFSVGSLIGGWISSRPAPRRRLGQRTAGVIAAGALALTAFWGRPILDAIEVRFLDAPNIGLLVSCLGLFFIPVTALSTFGPQGVHYLAAHGCAPGAASGIVYGVSTFGNIAGVMLTAFAFIPRFHVSTLMYGWVAVAVVSLLSFLAILQTVPTATSS